MTDRTKTEAGTVDPDTVLPTEQDATDHSFTAAETAFLRERVDPQFVGSPKTVTPRLAALLEETGADELFALTQVPDHEARIRSYELLAKIVSSL